MSTFTLQRPEQVLSEWSRLRELLLPAVKEGRGEVGVDDIKSLVLSGRMFVFASDTFAVTCEFIMYPKKTVMVVGFGAGKVPDRHVVETTLINFARSAGATAIQTYCKNPAMVRYYRRWFHLDPVYTVLEKQL